MTPRSLTRQPTTILALDLSLTSSGVCDDSGPFTVKTALKGVERLEYVADRVLESSFGGHTHFAILEGYTFCKGFRAHQIGELGGVVRYRLHLMGVPFFEVPPTILKKFATGKGGSDKDSMLEAAIRRFGFKGHGNDEADAFLLYQLALFHTGALEVSLTAVQTAAAVAYWGSR